MAVALLCLLSLVHYSVAAASSTLGVPAASSVCSREDLTALLRASLGSGCPRYIQHCFPREVSGDILDSELTHTEKSTFYSVLFYASWCPFSQQAQSTFDALSTMFPRIKHLTVKDSSSLPSLFSRYGVHSFPSIFLVSGSRKIQYHGSKDISSLVEFYEKITGLHPVVNFSVDRHIEPTNEHSIWPWKRTLREFMADEPYLTFSSLFLCLRVFLYFFPGFLSQLKVIWFIYVWCVNWSIFGEWNHLLERAMHIMDLKKLWHQLSLNNKTNFHRGAKNARAWASSFTSVSLGESCSSRPAPFDS